MADNDVQTLTPTRRLGWLVALLALVLASVVLPTNDAQAVCRVALGGPAGTDSAATQTDIDAAAASAVPADIELKLAHELLPPPAPALQPRGDHQIECGGGGGPLVGLSRGNFRTNLVRWTPTTRPKVVNYDAHHVFPVKFEARFNARGINIHHPRYGAWWQLNAHRSAAYSYNAQWQAWFDRNPLATQAQVLSFGRSLNAKYGLRSWF